MIIFDNPLHASHAPRHEIFRGKLVPCHENLHRLEYVLAELDKRPVGERRQATLPDRAVLEKIHHPSYLDFMASAWSRWTAQAPGNADSDILPSIWPARGLRYDAPTSNFSAQLGRYAFDTGSPIMGGTWNAALAGAACAIEAAKSVASKAQAAPLTGAAMALTRPPGHHAGPDFFGGYCFLNNAALAAQTLRDSGHSRVAVLDVDYHHCNGTQTIFYQRADVFTVSIHGDPTTEYPFYLGYSDERGEGAGQGYNLNLPLPVGTDFAAWSATLARALEAIQTFGASAVIVSLGVDTFEGDPISRFLLRSDDYFAVGQQIASLHLPTVFVMEGGYAVAEVGVNVVNVLEGFLG